MEITITFGVLMSIIIGGTQIAKGLGLPSRFCPLLALLLGVGISFLALSVELYSIQQIILVGIVGGLSSVGLYSGTKNTIQ